MNIKVARDHTLHAEFEGIIKWTSDLYAPKRRKRMNIVPMETPNRKVVAPPPFMYHPELYPELAKFNPEPSNFVVPVSKKAHVRNPVDLKASVVAQPSISTGFVDASKLFSRQQAIAKGYMNLASKKQNTSRMHASTEQMAVVAKQKLGLNFKDVSVVYAD
uniref:Uncharacterized protein n=1 Tax=Strombidium inclinatum TaxID=197538 RepID=A0A7S3IQ03_9SPIT|mmetsp:Transcript_29949/g.45804  ORF Transcript_29949/g.45804 Transcript_29949/m.45804 type:complete len:161 (+) Transcript_29949:179-661(+)